jgi:hypothetical protein
MLEILNNISALYELAKTFHNADLLKKISDLKIEIYNLVDENRELEEEIRRLKFNKDNPLEFRNGMYFWPGDDNPYCVRCYDADGGKRVHLIKVENFARLHTYICPACKSEHNSGEYRSS